jgi:hypothetical protein
MGYNTKKLLFAINKIVQMLVDCFVYNKLLFKWLLYIGEIVEKKKRRRDKQNISVAITHSLIVIIYCINLYSIYYLITWFRKSSYLMMDQMTNPSKN